MPVAKKLPLVTELKLENKHAATIRQTLRASAAQVSKDVSKLTASNANPISIMQLRAQQMAINAQLEQDWSKISTAIAQGKTDAVQYASMVVSQYENELLGAVMDKGALKALAASEASRAASGAEAMLQRIGGSSHIPLSESVYNNVKLSKGLVDAKINQALASGWDAKRLAKEVSGLINPDVPGGVSYAANRLGRTEINNAFHSSSIDRYKKSGVVEGAHWNLSGSHPEGDVCDDLKEDGPYDLDNVPGKPHPHCYCYATPELLEPDEFLDKLLAGGYGDEPWVAEVKRDKLLDVLPDPVKMSSADLSKQYKTMNEDLTSYQKTWKGTGNIWDDPTYSAINNRRILLRNEITSRVAAAPKSAVKAAKSAAASARESTKKVAALPKMAVPNTLKAAYVGGRANPNGKGWFGSAARDYQINCTRVAYAVEMRMRGFNVTAAPAGVSANKSNLWIIQNWIDPVTDKVRGLKKAASPASLERAMVKDAPDGARFFVVAPWKNGGAHIWNAEKVDGKILYHEGQASAVGTGTKEFTAARTTKMDFDTWKGTEHTVRWMRVDDLQPVDAAISRGWVEIDGKIVKNPK